MADNPFADIPKAGSSDNPFADIPKRSQTSTSTIDVPYYDPASGAGGFRQETVSTRKTADPVGVGTKAAVMEPILGIGEYIPGPIGRASAAKAKELEEEYKASAKKYPVATRVGYFGSLGAGLLAGGQLAPFLGAGAAAAETLPRLAQIGQTAKTGAKAGAIFGAVEPTGKEDYFDRLTGKAKSAAVGGAAGGLIMGAGSTLRQGAGALKDYLLKALGRPATKAEEELVSKATQAGKDVAAALTEKETNLLLQLEQEAASVAQKESKAARLEAKVPGALTGPKGTMEEMLGEKKRLAPTLDEVGTFIRDRVENFVKGIKSQRNANADRDVAAAFGDAAKKEQAGSLFMNSSDMKPLRDFIDKKLATETDQTLRKQLNEIRTALFGGGQQRKFSPAEIEAEMARLPSSFSAERKRQLAMEALAAREAEGGVVPSFQSSETIRRKLGDAAFGVPEEGYAAIGQNLAKDMYGKLSAAMKSFEPKFSTYLDNYKRLSENIESVGTKLGKALVGVEKDAPGYYATAARDLPARAFANPENVKILIEAMGNNPQPVYAAAERYFANKMAEEGTVEGARKFLTKDTTRSLLKTLGPEFEKRITEKYLAEATTLSRQSEKLVQQATDAANKITELNTQLGNIRKQNKAVNDGLQRIEDAVSDTQRREAASSLISSLEGTMPGPEYARLSNLIEQYKNASSERKEAIVKLAKYGGSGLATAGLGFAGYYGGKNALENILGR